MKPITFHPDADAEINEAARYYEDRSPGLGPELLSEVERALGLISRDPEAWRRIGKRVRRRSLWRFPYNVIYAVYPDRIRVVAFAHQRRRPFYWRKRQRESTEPTGPATL
ncbi:MAG: type II toxin-antitoxin system RelE/ParE family toxin [Phycisphaerales bacterium]